MHRRRFLDCRAVATHRPRHPDPGTRRCTDRRLRSRRTRKLRQRPPFRTGPRCGGLRSRLGAPARSPSADGATRRGTRAAAGGPSWTPEPVAMELSTKTDRLNRNLGTREYEVGVGDPVVAAGRTRPQPGPGRCRRACHREPHHGGPTARGSHRPRGLVDVAARPRGSSMPRAASSTTFAASRPMSASV